MLKRNLLLLALLAALIASVLTPSFTGQAGAANRTPTHAAAFDKTRFLLHLGAAYFVFHHWVYNPYKQGKFTHGGRIRRFAAIVKAGLALLFAYHEVKVAYQIAQSSNSKLLHAIIAPMNALGNAFQSIGNKFKKGQFSDSDVTNLSTQANGFQSLASKNGFGFHDNSNVAFH